MATLPDCAPNVVGLKVTTMLHEADIAKVAPQVVVLLYCPEVVMLVIFSVAVPELVSATV